MILLPQIWSEAVTSIEPRTLFEQALAGRRRSPSSAIFWGKAAAGFYQAWAAQAPGRGMALGISPDSAPLSDLPARHRWIQAEHPYPGRGSFQAGLALLEFFDQLRANEDPDVSIFLSGGASSLAWLPWCGQNKAKLTWKLERLYRESLTIRELNSRRAELCQLKDGGAAAWLQRLAPRTRAEVFVLSDVAPFGPEVVGSGPFWNRKIPHRVLADNSTLVNEIGRCARRAGLPVLFSASGCSDSIEDWASSMTSRIEEALKRNRRGILVLGGEPKVRLPRSSGKGGRQTHLALLLATRCFDAVLSGKIEILAMSSDGCDGNSSASGAHIHSGIFRRRKAVRREMEVALGRFDSAIYLARHRALMPLLTDGARRSNVQDVLMVRVR